MSEAKPLEDALKMIMREDPSLHVHVDLESGQTLISGMGELHLEIVKDRLLNDFKVKAEIGKMRISYRETITLDRIEHTNLYDREIMGKRTKAQVSVTIQPLPEGDQGVLSDGGNIVEFDLNALESLPEPQDKAKSKQQQYGMTNLTSIDIGSALRSGILSALHRGPILGFPLTGLRVKAHSVQLFGAESTKSAISTCVTQAVLQAVKKASPALLEPLMEVSIEVAEEYLGTVVSDLSGVRRGHILALETVGQETGNVFTYETKFYTPPDSFSSKNNTVDEGGIFKPKRIVRAYVPLSLMLGYASALRSLTAGNASFNMNVYRFGLMSEDRARAVIALNLK